MRQIRDPQFQTAEYRRTFYVATIAHGVTLDEIREPAYWAHVARKLRPLDRIECWWEDGSRYVELLVVKATNQDARCAILNDVDVRGSSAPVDLAKDLDKFEITYAGPDVGYRVTRKADRVELRSDSRWNEDDARRWLLDYLSQPGQKTPETQAAKPAKPAAQKPTKSHAPPGAPIPGKEAA